MKMQLTLREILAAVVEEVEEVEVAGRDCILVPGEGMGGPGGMGFEPDFSSFSDMDTYLMHEAGVILVASSAGGMRRALSRPARPAPAG